MKIIKALMPALLLAGCSAAPRLDTASAAITAVPADQAELLPTWTALPALPSPSPLPTLTPAQAATAVPEVLATQRAADQAAPAAGYPGLSPTPSGPIIDHFTVLPRIADWDGETLTVDWDTQAEQVLVCLMNGEAFLRCDDVSYASLKQTSYTLDSSLCALTGVRLIAESGGQVRFRTLPVEVICPLRYPWWLEEDDD